MNNVILSGYIASDVELKSTKDGTSVTSFSLAVKRPMSKNNITDFFTIVCWRGTAEFVSKHFQKGSGIEVAGTLTVRKFESKDDGSARYFYEVVANAIDFGKKSNSSNGNDEQSKDKYEMQDQVNADFEEISDQDLPF